MKLLLQARKTNKSDKEPAADATTNAHELKGYINHNIAFMTR